MSRVPGEPITALQNHVGAEPSNHVTTPIAHVGTGRLHSLCSQGLPASLGGQVPGLARFATLFAEGPNAGEGLRGSGGEDWEVPMCKRLREAACFLS